MKIINIDIYAKYYAMQIKFGWLTIEKVPKVFRERTQYFVDLANKNEDTAE